MASFKNPSQGNFIDETILSTPLPEATSTVNINKSSSSVAGSAKPISTSNLTSRLTGTIDELKSVHEALNSVEKLSLGQNNSILSVTDLAFEQKLGSKGSLGILDIDALLDKDPIYSKGDDSNKSRSSLMKIQALLDGSAVGVPSFFLTADSSVTEDVSISEEPLCSLSNAISETSAEVAAIMAKDSSFDSGRISFDQGEMSGRSTSLGASVNGSNRSMKSLKNMSGVTVEGEEFLADEKLLERLQMDELSFTEKQLPPIIHPDQISNPNSSAVSVFSGVQEGEKIMVRPSWIGLEAENDDPINISIGQYFRMKSDCTPRHSGLQTSDKRPSFGMKITSPERRGQQGLISQSFDSSILETSNSTPERSLNLTQVITPKCHRPSQADEEANETNADMTNLSVVSTPSLSCINNILHEIDMNDSHGTMADKLLRYSSSSTGSKRQNRDLLSNTYSEKNNVNAFPENNVESKAVIEKQKINVWTPKVPPRGETVKANREFDYLSNKATDGEGVKYKIRDVVKKLNSIEKKGLSDKSALKVLSNFVNKLESNVAGPLDCSALYESLSNDKLVSAGPLNVGKEDRSGAISFASECSGGKCWVEVPKELLLVPDGDGVQLRHCIGIGFTAHVPIRNQTNEWLMYQVSPANCDGELLVEELPIQTLLAPNSLVEFEVIVVPMCAGKHFADIEIKVTNFMVQRDNSRRQSYFTRLVLSASIPSIKLMTEELVELGDKEVLKFGVLPEACSKTVLVHILNIGLSNIPIRVVIDEAPEALKAFRISAASRSPLSNASSYKYYHLDSSHAGIHLEREDLLSCDLSGSGPNAMVAVSITGQAPRFDCLAHRVPSDLSELGARLRVELDVPSNMPSELTVLKEVMLSGLVALTKLKVDIEKEPLTLFSEEVISLSQHSKGAVPKKIPGSQRKYKMVSELIPLSNLGAVSLNLTLSVRMMNGKEIEGDEDELSVIPDSLSLQPEERSSVRVIYQPKFNESLECNRLLSISMGPNGTAIRTIALKGVPMWREEADNEPMTFSCPTDSSHPVIQTTHPRLVWGSVPVNSDYSESVFTLRNPSPTPEKIVLSIRGSKDYKLLNHELDIVGNTSFEMLPKQSEKIKIFFRPKMLGPSVGKLIISVYDNSHRERKIADKMITLSGYGGCSIVEVISLPKDLSGRLWLNLGLISSNSACNTSLENYSPQASRSSLRSPSPTLLVTTVKNRLQIHNSGSLPAFVKIVPLQIGINPETLSHLEEGREHNVTVRPEFCELEPSTSATIWVSYVHRLHDNVHDNNREASVKRGNERAYEEVSNLLIMSGDLPTRSRLQKIYKTAEVTQSKKDPAKFLGLSATLMSFMGVTSCFGTKPELEEVSESSGQDDALNSLCDPISKETVHSLVQTLTTTEVLLVVEKEEDQRKNDSDATLTSEDCQLFHSLLDVTNQQPSFLGEVPAALKSRPSSKLWSIEPGSTVYLGSVGGLSATVLLVSHSSEDIFFEARVGFVEMDGRLKLIPPPHRKAIQTSQIPLVVVEPWQGRLLPHACIKMKVILQEMSEYPSKSGILQVYSENDCLKINIKIEGCASQNIPKEKTWKNIQNNEGILKKSIERKNRLFCGVKGDKTECYGNANMQSCQPKAHLTGRHKSKDHFPVSTDTDSLAFPTMKVGSSVVLKLTLRNPSNETYEVTTYHVPKPYIVPKGSWELRANYYFSIKVVFAPESEGNYEETLAIKVVSQDSLKKNILKVSLRGRAKF